MEIITFLISAFLLVIYLGWGVYSLRLRYRHHQELSLSFEGVTLVALLLFYAFELNIFRYYFRNSPIYLLFAVLGLIVSSTALYGPMMVSLVSRLMVDAITSRDETMVHEPRYSPAQALERQGDYEGALQEYRVMARIFPNDPTSIIRIADNMAKLGEMEESAEWFERSLKVLDSPEKSLMIVNRLHQIYIKELERADDATRVLEEYLQKYPDAEYASSVQRRLDGLVKS